MHFFICLRRYVKVAAVYIQLYCPIHFVIGFILLHQLSQAQFTDVSGSWDIPISSNSAMFGNGLCVYDFNHDGLDDIAIAENNSGIACYASTGNGFQLDQYIAAPYSIMQITFVDYDNDGDDDLFYTTNGNGFYLLENVGGNYTIVQNDFLNYADKYSYGACWGDVDRNGLLDVFICSYHYFGTEPTPNLFFLQNEPGLFQESAALFGVDGMDNNYFQPCFFDFNSDNWPDLYIIQDHHHGNEFYLNQNGENFENISATNGSGVELDAMCNSISDYDNDGDFDIFITNGLHHYLLQQEEDYFTNSAEQAGVEGTENGWGGLWLDYDHDMHEDLNICTGILGDPLNVLNHLMRNNGDQTFSDTGFYTSNEHSSSCAKGDFNGDGYWDIAYRNMYPDEMVILLNDASGKNWIKISLQGVVSNRNGIGSSIEYFVQGQRKVLQTQCGENYISQDSQYEILSIGESTIVDSLFVQWPSGWTDKYYNLDHNTFYSLIEGETFLQNVGNNIVNLCANDSLTLHATGGVQYHWNTDETTDSITIYNPGIYSVAVTNEYGIQDTVYTTVETPPQASYTINATHVTCNDFENGSAEILLQSTGIVIWSPSDTTNYLDNLNAGTYYFQIIDPSECTTYDSVVIHQPSPLHFQYETNLICYDMTTASNYVISGGSPPYNVDWSLADPENLSPGEYSVQVTDSFECELDTSYVIQSYPEIVVEWESDTVCVNESIPFVWTWNGLSNFDDANYFGLDTTSVSAGIYPVVFTDENQCSLDTSLYIAEYAMIEIDFSFAHETENGNGFIELMVEGGEPPYTFDWNNACEDPTNDSIAAGIYECIVTDMNGCQIAFSHEILELSIAKEHRMHIKVFPNPFGDQLHLSAYSIPSKICIYDSYGKKIIDFTPSNTEFEIPTGDWPAGIYLLQTDGQIMRIIKE